MKQFLNCTHFKRLYSINIKYSIRDESIKKCFSPIIFSIVPKGTSTTQPQSATDFLSTSGHLGLIRNVNKAKVVFLPLEILFYSF